MFVVFGRNQNYEPKPPPPTYQLSLAVLFVVGDTVAWTNNTDVPLRNWYKREYGEGPFVVEKITSTIKELTWGVHYGTVHPQTLYFRGEDGRLVWLGGSWFAKIAS
jgi:hypothetical protein